MWFAFSMIFFWFLFGASAFRQILVLRYTPNIPLSTILILIYINCFVPEHHICSYWCRITLPKNNKAIAKTNDSVTGKKNTRGNHFLTITSSCNGKIVKTCDFLPCVDLFSMPFYKNLFCCSHTPIQTCVKCIDENAQNDNSIKTKL